VVEQVVWDWILPKDDGQSPDLRSAYVNKRCFKNIMFAIKPVVDEHGVPVIDVHQFKRIQRERELMK
jgi:hypothetical protein